jgi:cell division protein FtsN
MRNQDRIGLAGMIAFAIALVLVAIFWWAVIFCVNHVGQKKTPAETRSEEIKRYNPKTK